MSTTTVTEFQRTVWSASFIRSLAENTSLRNHCDFTYEKDATNAKEIKILSANRPTIRKYVPGTAIEREHLNDSSQTLRLDQYHYFNFDLDDVIKAQSIPGAMELATDEASRGLALEGDKYVAQIVKEGVTNGTIEASDVTTITNKNAMESVDKGFAALYKNNCKPTDTFYLELAPDVYVSYRQQLTEVSTNNPEILKKGAVGKINNALVCIENCLPTDDNACYNILRTSKAIAFAEQIEKLEHYRPHDGFEDAIKGLYVFGAKVVRPNEIYVMKTAK